MIKQEKQNRSNHDSQVQRKQRFLPKSIGLRECLKQGNRIKATNISIKNYLSVLTYSITNMFINTVVTMGIDNCQTYSGDYFLSI